ncbi:zincin-like metalloproteases family protein [Actinidia rufa]|uniref:Zincin-like metalloproteases family protein n=1 Tax=Actinidia rufa TaxID=165716 RepID=A0A7J0GWK0_9ERIC|nr:zincin-like metalloproteases family protein [Actinidia rufa]
MTRVAAVMAMAVTVELVFEGMRWIHRHYRHRPAFQRAMWGLIRRPVSKLRLGTNHFFHTSTAPQIKDTGLYGFHHLKTPKGFQRFVDNAIERSGELINYISGMPSSDEIVRAMDELSDTVRFRFVQLWTLQELCRHTHPDREFVEEANKASMRINEYLHVRFGSRASGTLEVNKDYEEDGETHLDREFLGQPRGGLSWGKMHPTTAWISISRLTLWSKECQDTWQHIIGLGALRRLTIGAQIHSDVDVTWRLVMRCTATPLNMKILSCFSSIEIPKSAGNASSRETSKCLMPKSEKEGHFLSKEAQRAAHSLRVDFEKGGIHLSADKLDRVNQLNIDICQLCREFNENIITDPGYVDIYPASRIPKLLHHLVEPIYRSTSNASREPSNLRENMREKGFRIVTEPSTLSSVLQWASDSEVRKMVYIQGNSVPSGNIGVLDKLIAARHEISQIMGYKSYAEFSVHPNMASSPEIVKSFLLEMSEMVRPKADKEFKKIWDFKREKSGQINSDLEPWDEAYFTGLMKSSAYSLDSLVVASFFPLPQCIEGLRVLVESLFGVKFHSIPLAPGEAWHPDVLKMSLYHHEEGDLGYLYLDLNSRAGKYPGCAHFAIKGGRRISETEYQLPVVALVCNFSGSRCSGTARLNHWEVETLFHEFGHALHSLLSRTDYQHFSGTRVVLDFAETPSNLFEYYAWDYRVLKRFARHYSTGEVIPEKLVESIQGAKKMFAATELQRQVLYALMDQTLFGEQPSSPIDTISVVGDLKRRHTSWKHADGTHWHTRFSHLGNYGAVTRNGHSCDCWNQIVYDVICQKREERGQLRTRGKQSRWGAAEGLGEGEKEQQGDEGYRICRSSKGGAAVAGEEEGCGKLVMDAPELSEQRNLCGKVTIGHGRDRGCLQIELMEDIIDWIGRWYRDGGIVPDTTSLCREMDLVEG